MHEDFDTEGFIPSSIGAGVPGIPEYGGYPAGRGKAGLLQLGREAPTCGEGHEVSRANGRRSRTSYVQARQHP
jgi:hypothetical protein